MNNYKKVLVLMEHGDPLFHPHPPPPPSIMLPINQSIIIQIIEMNEWIKRTITLWSPGQPSTIYNLDDTTA